MLAVVPVLTGLAAVDGTVAQERNQAAYRYQRCVHHAPDSWRACVLMVEQA